MRNKKFITLAAALMLTMQAALATNISGVTGNNGVFNINPEISKGGAGFRHYENFYLSKGDIANLIFKHGNKNLDTFINFVDNTVNVGGILNSVRDGQFYAGNTMFIAPNGMIVGESGVINVGNLSVLTPSDNTYQKLLKDPTNINIKEVQEETNGDILVRGTIFARGNVNLQGAHVTLPETANIMNGVRDNVIITSQKQASDILFNNLVNTQNLDIADKEIINGKIVLKSNAQEGGVNVRGNVYNLAKGSTKLVNFKGDEGIKVTGQIHNTNGDLALINNAGKTLIKGDIINSNGNLSISDNGQGIHINSGANVISNSGDMRIANNGSEGLAIYGDVLGLDKNMTLINNKGKLYVAGNVNYKGDGELQIINNVKKGSSSMIATGSNISSNGDLYIGNKSDGGLFINGNVSSDRNLSLLNKGGDLTINNKVSNKNGSMTLMNTGNKLAVSSKGIIEANGKNLVVKNSGENGMFLDGSISNNGKVTSITNTAGDMTLNGKIDAQNGNLGIINKGNSMIIASKADINNEQGRTNIINSGKGDMRVYGNINTKNSLDIINSNDQMTIGGKINSENGDLRILAKDNSTGMDINKYAEITNNGNSTTINNANGNMIINGKVDNKSGNVIVKNTGDNMDINGTITNSGEIASIMNTGKGVMTVNGTINSTNGNLGITNRGSQLVVGSNAIINNDNGVTNLINVGADGMEVNGKVNANNELNIINDNGKFNINGTVKGNDSDVNILSRRNSEGLTIGEKAEISNISENSQNNTGSITIKNTSNKGENGLEINGKIDSINDINIANTKNDTTIAGQINSGKDIILTQTTQNGKVTILSDAKINAEGNIDYRLRNGSKLYQ